MKHYFSISENLQGYRLDKALQILMSPISRTLIQRSIRSGNVMINQRIINDLDVKVKIDDTIHISLQEGIRSDVIQPANISLDIIYEDADLIVINKQAGLTVHPGNGNHDNTLANALVYHYQSLSDINGTLRPGIIHRLDKDTSGLLIVAKNNLAHAQIAYQIETKQLVRKYKALIWGIMNPQSGTLEYNIARSKIDRTKMAVVRSGGKHAITHYKTEKIFLGGLISLIECTLDTGRTHQIRLHLSYKGHSVVGDQTYGHNNRKISKTPNPCIYEALMQLKRQALHSYYIAFIHPVSRQSLEFTIHLPNDMIKLIEIIV